jgi:RecA/RadA recombinase
LSWRPTDIFTKGLGKYVNDFKAKLVIIDGIISLRRAEFAGRGTLADRQHGLNGMLHKIIRLAEIINIAVVITNQVQSSPYFVWTPYKSNWLELGSAHILQFI